jgi:hypothetical protein
VPIPPDFAKECLYGPEHWFVHDVLELGPERVVARVDTTRLGSPVDAQVVRPGHDKHLPGAVVIQVTGTLGNLHAVYGLGLRFSEGWVGFGTHVRGAKFPSMGRIGPPVDATLTLRRVRTLGSKKFLEYAFLFEQEGRAVYAAEHAAIWFLGDPAGR